MQLGKNGGSRFPSSPAAVLYATHAKQVVLIVVVPVRVLVVVVHVPVVSVVAIVLIGTPPVAVVADIVEIAIGIAVATRQGGKAAEASIG
jgi:hypothetical protein